LQHILSIKSRYLDSPKENDAEIIEVIKTLVTDMLAYEFMDILKKNCRIFTFFSSSAFSNRYNL